MRQGLAEYLHKILLTPKKRRINLIKSGGGKCDKEITIFATLLFYRLSGGCLATLELFLLYHFADEKKHVEL